MGEHANEELERFTVGHDDGSIERFVAMLEEAGIVVIIDIRSRSYSRYLPHFTRKSLEAALSAREIAYLYLGDTLAGASVEEVEAGGEMEDGARGEEMDAEGADRDIEAGARNSGAGSGRGGRDIQSLEKDDRFRDGIERMLMLLEQIPGRVAVMCAEEEPSRCRRIDLVAPVLREKGVVVIHLSSEARWRSNR